MRKTVSTIEAAKYLDVGTSTVQRLFDKGKFEGYYRLVTGERILYKDSVEKFLELKFKEHLIKLAKKGGDKKLPAIGGTD